MKNILFTAIATGAALLSTASAQVIDVEVDIDTSLLETEAGRQQVFEILEAEAEEACMFQGAFNRVARPDAECSSDILDQMLDSLGERMAAFKSDADAYTRIASN